MRRISLPGTDLAISRFSFGTASLFRAGTPKKREWLLAAACDQGFTHFDTAPYYGFGTAERDLRSVLRDNPSSTVATKVGIYSPGGETQSDASVLLRKVAGRLVPPLSRPTIDWSVNRARGALTQSLHRLGRERVDLYLLHEPEPALFNAEEWLRWLESERDRVAHFGIAVDSRRLRQFIGMSTALTSIVQTIDSLENLEATALLDNNRPLQITYGYVSTARRHGSIDVHGVLRGALKRNQTGSVIVSTGKPERLRQYAEISNMVDREMADEAQVQ